VPAARRQGGSTSIAAAALEALAIVVVGAVLGTQCPVFEIRSVFSQTIWPLAHSSTVGLSSSLSGLSQRVWRDDGFTAGWAAGLAQKKKPYCTD